MTTLSQHFSLENTKTMTKMLLPSLEYQFSFNKFKNCIKNTKNREFQKALSDKKYSLLKENQRNMLIQVKFETKKI